MGDIYHVQWLSCCGQTAKDNDTIEAEIWNREIIFSTDLVWNKCFDEILKYLLNFKNDKDILCSFWKKRFIKLQNMDNKFFLINCKWYASFSPWKLCQLNLINILLQNADYDLFDLKIHDVFIQEWLAFVSSFIWLYLMLSNSSRLKLCQ